MSPAADFGSRHRHVFVLHTDQAHPHVHLVIKAVSEQGDRLHIRPPMLRKWRRDFAANLRELGVAANATERAVRGQVKTRKRDGIYRSSLRGESIHMRDRERRATGDPGPREEEGRQTLLETRQQVVEGWRAVSLMLAREGYQRLASKVESFLAEMPSVQTDREALQQRMLTQRRQREPRTR